MKLVAAGADFSGADFSGANVSGANIAGANIADDRFWPRRPRLLGL
jgi:uncharacterized protein YjbI with pentapeptide repeats